jgi:N-carbamoylputrescine amidase
VHPARQSKDKRLVTGGERAMQQDSQERRQQLPAEVSVGLVQMACGPDPEANRATAMRLIGQASDRGANVICLQELFLGPYPCQTEDHARFAAAEPIPGPTCHHLGQAAAEHQVVLIGSLFEERGPGLYHNTAVVWDADGRQLGLYRKMHIPDDPCYYEKFYFAPGDLGFPCFDTRFGRVGVGICWDQWFPETARLLALRGAEILFFPTAIGWLHDEKAVYGESQQSAWETVMRSHAITNGLFVAAANRVGSEEQIEFWGSSFVVDPYGQVLVRGSRDQQEVLVATCSRSLVRVARTHWPFLRDRRIDAYADLQQRYLD